MIRIYVYINILYRLFGRCSQWCAIHCQWHIGIDKTDVIPLYILLSILFSWLKNYIWRLSDGSDLHTWFDVSWVLCSIVIYDRLLFFFISKEAPPWCARATDIYEFVNMYAGIIWITKRQSNVRQDKCSSENEVLSTAHQLHSSSKAFNTKTLLIDRIDFIETLFNINSIFLHFNGKSSLFIRAKEFPAFIFFLWYFNGQQNGMSLKIQIYWW